MFGHNTIVGQKRFKDAPDKSLFVTSIFYTIQGEGPLMGHPAIFIRLGLCNLACSFCDTYFDAGEWMTFDEIKDEVRTVVQSFWGNQGLPVPESIMHIKKDGVEYPGLCLVITGGEPLLQPNLLDFLDEQKFCWDYMQIETNGTLDISKYTEMAMVVVSPKCVGKEGNEHYNQPSEANLKYASALKFVVSADPQSPYHEIPEWALGWARDQSPAALYVSPMNVYNDEPREAKIAFVKNSNDLAVRSTVGEKISFWEQGLLNREANQANHEYAGKLCLQYGARLNLQMHLYASLA